MQPYEGIRTFSRTRMRRRTLLLTLASVAASLIVLLLVVLVVVPEYYSAPITMTKRASLILTNTSSPPWHLAYCFPSGTTFHFSWNTSTGESVNFTIWTADLLMPLQYRATASSGSGSLYSEPTENFQAASVSPSSTIISLQLSYNYTIPPGDPQSYSGGSC